MLVLGVIVVVVVIGLFVILSNNKDDSIEIKNDGND